MHFNLKYVFFNMTIDYVSLSILIPCFNSASSLERAVNSILKTKNKNIECIILDDGSSDNSVEIANKLAFFDPRIKIYSHDCNKGIGKTRNDLLRLSNGNLIVWLDPDDFVLDGYIDFILEEYKKKPFDILLLNYFEIKDNTVLQFKYKLSPGLIEFYSVLRGLAFDWTFPSQLWNKIYSKKIAMTVSFPEDVELFEDYFVQLSLFEASSRSVFASDSYYFYNRTDNSLISKKTLKKEMTQLNVRIDRVKVIKNKYPSMLTLGIYSILFSLLNSGYYLSINGVKREELLMLKNIFLNRISELGINLNFVQRILIKCYNPILYFFLNKFNFYPIIKKTWNNLRNK